jgi:hypothetical protein
LSHPAFARRHGNSRDTDDAVLLAEQIQRFTQSLIRLMPAVIWLGFDPNRGRS